MHIQLPSQVTQTAAAKSQTSAPGSPQAAEHRKQNRDSQWTFTAPRVDTVSYTHSTSGNWTQLPSYPYPREEATPTCLWQNAKTFGEPISFLPNTEGRSLCPLRRGHHPQ